MEFEHLLLTDQARVDEEEDDGGAVTAKMSLTSILLLASGILLGLLLLCLSLVLFNRQIFNYYIGILKELKIKICF